MTSASNVIRLPVFPGGRPATPGALIEAAEASGLSDDQIGNLILKFFPLALEPDWTARRRALWPGYDQPMTVDDVPSTARARLRVVGDADV